MSKFSVQVARLVEDERIKTQERLSKDSGVDRSTINKIINGTSSGTAGNARDLVKAAPDELKAQLLQAYLDDFLDGMEGLRAMVSENSAPIPEGDALLHAYSNLSQRQRTGLLSLASESSRGSAGATSYLDTWCTIIGLK